MEMLILKSLDVHQLYGGFSLNQCCSHAAVYTVAPLSFSKTEMMAHEVCAALSVHSFVYLFTYNIYSEL